MIVSEMKAPQNGVLSAIVRAETTAEHSSVEEYLYAFDRAAAAAGYYLAGRPAWRMVPNELASVEISACVLPEVRLANYLERTLMVRQGETVQRALGSRVVDALVYESELQLPSLAIDTEEDHQWRLLQARLEKSRITLQQHLTRLRKTEPEFRAKLRGYAEEDMKKRFVLLAIARAEGYSVADDELQGAVLDAQSHGIRLPDRMQLRQKLLAQKVMDLIWQNTTIIPMPAQEDPS